jgi:hypothetical protein
MPRFRLSLIAVAILALVVPVRAQELQISVDSNPAPGDVNTWLKSGDPRLVAWGAYFAGLKRGDDSTAQLLRLVDNWKEPSKVAQGGIGQAAMSEVLDALIQQRREVAPRQLASIAGSFPAQAAILASRIPIADATPMLLAWYGDGANNNGSRLDRVAAMMLSKAPPQGFAAGIVAASSERLSISVVDGGGFGSGFGGGCLCGLAMRDRTDWPPIFVYRLEENKAGSTDPVLIEAGGDRITYHRAEEGGGGGGCGTGVGPLDDRARHDLLAEMVGLNKEAMPWKEQESASIQWSDGESFLRDLQNLEANEEAKLHETVEALFEKGLLTANEVNSLRPKLLITVTDDREHQDAALPQWNANDPLTVITFDSPETRVSD